MSVDTKEEKKVCRLCPLDECICAMVPNYVLFVEEILNQSAFGSTHVIIEHKWFHSNYKEWARQRGYVAISDRALETRMKIDLGYDMQIGYHHEYVLEIGVMKENIKKLKDLYKNKYVDPWIISTFTGLLISDEQKKRIMDIMNGR